VSSADDSLIKEKLQTSIYGCKAKSAKTADGTQQLFDWHRLGHYR